MFGTVITTERLTPELVRVVFGGEGLADYEPIEPSDAYVNMQFIPEGAPYSAPFADDAIRALPREQRPLPRRYTVRRWDPVTRLMTIDFVVHGDVGMAGRWALRAEPGDQLQFRGPGGSYSPPAEADVFLFVGDESALPAIAACAEVVPEGKPAYVVVEVETAAGQIQLNSPGELHITWVHRSGPSRPTESLLVDAVSALALPDGVVSAFVHGEAVAVRGVRRHLLEAGVVGRDHLSASPYWRRGYTDEEWRTIKSAWQRDVALDVP